MPLNDSSLDVVILSRQPIKFAGGASGLEPFFKLEHRRVKCGEREDDRIVWARGDFVLIVAVTSEQKVVLIREYKQAIEQTVLCLPAGGIKKSESPEVAALRELKEETGFVSATGSCYVFGPFFNSPDKSTERHFVVVVTEAEKQGQAAPEESETIFGVQSCTLLHAKDKMLVGLHRMALDVACEFLAN